MKYEDAIKGLKKLLKEKFDSENSVKDSFSFLQEVAKRGPTGYLISSDFKDSILISSPDKTVLHLKGDDVAMWRMSHVHFLLSDRGNKTELETRQAMKQCGWV